MPDVEIKLKEGAVLNIEDVARIACALKSLAVYTSLVCEQEDSPDELRELVDQGLDSINNLFE
jgi:aryl carrier-like protein